MKKLISKAAEKINKTESAIRFADLVASLRDMPPNAFGDPKAAAEFGKEVAKGASQSQEAEAETAAKNFEQAQFTYRNLAEKSESESERERILREARLSEEKADDTARYRVDSNERIWKSAIKVVGVVAIGVIGIGLAGAAYALSKK